MLEHEAMAVLISAQGVGYAHRARALREAGSALAVIKDPYAYEKALGEGGAHAVRAAVARSSRMLDGLYRDGVTLIVRGSSAYPRLLEHIARPPHLLFCLGRADVNDAFLLAVVGTRRASRYGLEQTRSISRDLALAGMSIVSGLALGVDAAAHQGALDAGGRTVAVLGGALDRFYPMENWNLMQQIIASGGSVISEYAPGTPPSRYSFLERNRIIAGMSLGTLVTQAPNRSGASHTARCALEEGREVFAIPGDIDRAESALPNRLIAEGAHLTTCAADILDQLVIERRQSPKTDRKAKAPQSKPHEAAVRDESARTEPAVQANAFAAAARTAEPALEGEIEKAVYQALREGEADFDALSERIRASSDELGAALMMMELDGVVESLPGCRYRLT